MDPTPFGPADWAALTSSIPRIAALAGLALSVGLILALLLTFLFGTPESPDVGRAEPRAVGPFDIAAAPEPWNAPAERPEPALVAAPARAGAATADPLAGVGFSPTDLIALRMLRERVRSGDVAERPTGADRRAFARWLVEHGRLSG